MIESFFGSLLAKIFYDSVKDNFNYKETSQQIVIEKNVQSDYINWLYESERNDKWQK
tara:strand:+ start:146 stop:316 length:171 start_codon:yes stop_codon:yes gene_type:complete